jgi:hypothetical protein
MIGLIVAQKSETNKIMKKLLLLFSLCVLTKSIHAQTDQPNQYKKHFGFNTNIVFNNIFQSGATPFTLLYKKQVKENQALRLGASVNLNIDDGKRNNGVQINNSVSIQLTLGKEFQRELTKHWIWYGGGDVIPNYSYSIQQITQTINGPEIKNTQTSYGLGLRPFLGIRFNINSRLYVATEASLNLSFSNYSQTSSDNTATYENSGNRFNLGSSPAGGLFLFYMF